MKTETPVIQQKLIEVGIAFEKMEDAFESSKQQVEELRLSETSLREELAVVVAELEHLKGVELANHQLELNNSRLQYRVSMMEQEIASLRGKLEASSDPAVIASFKQALEAEQVRSAELEKELDHVKSCAMEATEALEQQTPELNRQRELLERQHTVIIKQKGELDKLLDKHNTEVRKANAAIQNLESLLSQQKTANKALKSKLQKKGIKAPVPAEPKKGSADPVWRHGKESLTLAGPISLMGKDGPIATDQVMWWEHDSGVKLVCAYSHESDQVMICDPRDAEGNLLLPCKEAVDFIMKTFSKQKQAA